MKNRIVMVALLLMLGWLDSKAVALDFPATLQSSHDSALAREHFVLAEINRIRNERGLPELKLNAKLREVARRHSADMAAAGYFSHTSPSGQGLKDRLGTSLGSRFLAGENIQRNDYPDPARVAIQGWLKSPGHLQNILNEKFTETGIGVAADSEGIVFFTQVFVGR